MLFSIRRREAASGLLAMGFAIGLTRAGAAAVAKPARGSISLTLAALLPRLLARLQITPTQIAIDHPAGPPIGRESPALARFLDGVSDFALLTREIAEDDLERFRINHSDMSPTVIPVAAGNWRRFGYTDAVVFVVHPTNPLTSITFAQIDAIYSSTPPRAQRWWRRARLG